MPKQRTPISSRLRSRCKVNSKIIPASKLDGTSFSSSHDTTIHPDELQDAISREGGTKRKREAVLSEEADKTADSFDVVRARSSGASFDASCPQSKKHKTSRKEREIKRLQLDSIHCPMVSTSGPYTQVPGASSAVFTPQQKKQRASKRKLELKRLQIDSKVFKSLPDTSRLSRLRSSAASTKCTPLSLLAHNNMGPYQMKQEQQPDGSPLLAKRKKDRPRTEAQPLLLPQSTTSNEVVSSTSAAVNSGSANNNALKSIRSNGNNTDVSYTSRPMNKQRRKLRSSKKKLLLQASSAPSLVMDLSSNEEELWPRPYKSQGSVKRVTFSCPIVAEDLPMTTKANTMPLGVYKPRDVPIPLISTTPKGSKKDEDDANEEYYRKQHRLFVHSRYISDQEAVLVAMSVYTDQSIEPDDQLVRLLQANFSKYRMKLKSIFDDLSRIIILSKEKMMEGKRKTKIYISEQLTDEVFKSVWGHWIEEPYIDKEEFYESEALVSLLKEVTVQAILSHYKEKYEIISTKEYLEQMKQLDRITRALNLP
ncbi:hypothetical protein RO3G_02132 [Rhizopus delemar RA 99-880]|uniref:Uncharacterized protein n=1 Tax=Rhizopus delemar (strain RA 99-880 / ATCC MYA-4621 / FGSC 9543 / NRRL 43880) TaxID=246409 RepID=I1BMJ8_RHIO9|nr:hypothetical protein RO3G_02132 [Rhizopus delemar RA 99-880]|eukprot:EIE77428.1 hypothetical protein RO3G_02132 [Rhizopus delemar RA 99-880]